MSAFANFSPYTASPEENRGAYQPIGDGPSQPSSSSNQAATSAEEGRGAFNAYETSTQIPYEIEAALVYLLGCLTGILFLIIEQKNDYVRFHAWQASILGVITLLLQGFVAMTLSFLNWPLFIVLVLLAVFLAYQAYSDANSLVRYHLPYLGFYAAKWTDEE
ncbi:hypothetical protein DSO57_1034923 [Entomophthora muscae]|uniref:Uncharacterized protein n=1 Tax=Entomophthora muscae TaxID=34485 RepID=A0ACC2SCS7_9FUNG|nr:hypothetical protein DSO57_1034923 [Entomophthora muscae]